MTFVALASAACAQAASEAEDEARVYTAYVACESSDEVYIVDFDGQIDRALATYDQAARRAREMRQPKQAFQAALAAVSGQVT